MHIIQLALWTHDLPAQHAFYAEQLGLPVVAYTDTRLELRVGTSRLIWTPAPADWRGSYHVACTIPANQFAAATAWLRARVALIADHAGRETFVFPGWDAEACYFFDPAGNIGELIARHTLANAATVPFSAASLLHISEIGLVVHDVTATVAQLHAQCGLRVYGEAGDEFAPVGDAHGLLIVVKAGRSWFPDTGIPAVVAPFTATLRTASGQWYTLQTTVDGAVRCTPGAPALSL